MLPLLERRERVVERPPSSQSTSMGTVLYQVGSVGFSRSHLYLSPPRVFPALNLKSWALKYSFPNCSPSRLGFHSDPPD